MAPELKEHSKKTKHFVEKLWSFSSKENKEKKKKQSLTFSTKMSMQIQETEE